MLSHPRPGSSRRRAGRKQTIAIVAGVIALTSSFGHAGAARAQAASPRYPTMAPVDEYRITNRDQEIALARTAAPPSISAAAEVLVLGERGYETAVNGTNGFVCFVERSWAAPFSDPDFWNPTVRAPNCFNAAAARTELPQLRTRTEWVLAGATKPEIIERTRSAYANHTFKSPEPSAFTYMLSKGFADAAGSHWLPHLMFFVPHDQTTAWGACREELPIICHEGSEIETTVLLVPVRAWSDGSTALPAAAPHTQDRR